MIVNVSDTQVELAAEDAMAEVNLISGEIAPNALVKKYERINTTFQLNFMLSLQTPVTPLSTRSRDLLLKSSFSIHVNPNSQVQGPTRKLKELANAGNYPIRFSGSKSTLIN